MMSTSSMVRSPECTGGSKPNCSNGGPLRKSNGMPRWENEARHFLHHRAPRLGSLSHQLSAASGLSEPGATAAQLKRTHTANEHDRITSTTSFKHTQYTSNRARRSGAASPVMAVEDPKRAIAKKYHVSYVELVRQKGEALGIIISGGADRSQPVTITQLKEGSIAARSEALEVGDIILAVNGTATRHLRHQEVVGLLQHAGAVVSLEIEYELGPEDPPPGHNLRTKTVAVTLKREGDGFGFKLRGGEDEGRGRLLTFSHVHPGSDGYGQGLIKIGDRLLTINHIDVTGYNVSAALALLKKCKSSVTLDIEYDVNIQEGLEECNPLVVELTKSTGVSLGITLSGSQMSGDPIFISHVRDGGIADRCGALHAGDRILSINNRSLESCSLPDAVQLLLQSGNTIRLEVVPGSKEDLKALEEAIATGGMKSADEQLPPPPMDLLVDDGMDLTPMNTAGMNGEGAVGTPTSTGYGSGMLGDSMATPTGALAYTPDSGALSIASSCLQTPSRSQLSSQPAPLSQRLTKLSMDPPATSTLQRKMTSMLICRQETMDVELKADSYGFGFALQSFQEVYSDSHSFMISSIEPDGPADRLNTLQVGDTIVRINGTPTSGMSAEQASGMIHSSGGVVTLTVEFDVAEGVVPSSGLFDVKLMKQGHSLGITINGGLEEGRSSQLWVSQVKKGGVAYRSGMLQAGDYLIAVNGKSVDGLTLTQAAELLKTNSEFVTLQIKKDPRVTGSSSSVVLTVEITRHGENLGVTLNGSNLPGEPIYVARIKEDGVAYKTGALLEGDILLSINSHSLHDSNLEDTVDMLRKAGDNLTFRIRRAAKKPATSSVSTSDAADNLEVFNITSSSSPSKHHSRRPSQSKSTFSGSQWSPEDKVFYGDSPLGARQSAAASAQEQKTGTETNGDVRSEQSVSPYSIRTLSNSPPANGQSQSKKTQRMNPENLAILEEAKRLHEQWKLAQSAKGARVDQSNGFQLPLQLSKSFDNMNQPSPTTERTGLQRGEFGSHARTRFDQQYAQTPTYATANKPSSHSGQNTSSANRPRLMTDGAAYSSPHRQQARGRPQHARSLTGLNAQDNMDNGRHPQAGSTYSLTYDRDTGQSPVNQVIQRQYEPSYRSSRRRTASTSSGRRSVTPQSHEDPAYSQPIHVPIYAEPPNSSGRPPPLPKRNTPSLAEPELQYHHIELHRPQLKNSAPAGFGFSISDGKDVPGVYVRALQPNGVAEMSDKIFPLDRIMEVNNFDVRNCDCRQTLPLLAASGDILKLVVCRSVMPPVLASPARR